MKETNSFDLTLRSDDFLLRPWRVDDAQWYVESRDDEVFRWTDESRDLTVEEARAAIRRANENPDAACFAIVDSESLELLGNIALAFREKDRSSAEIMYWLAPQGRGRGLATRSVGLLCRWAFDALQLERVTLKARRGNPRSQLVAKRAGFRRVEASPDFLRFELAACSDR